ncbi:protein UNUSUAL FLORAL ORGANS-like [Euphorbia lathyris]|uniref:protein UNUSUAL FLORAL ORGANS-like n=1 Tax=Euphorbia lathyris TaxID=212925 RepID=UPI003313BD84
MWSTLPFDLLANIFSFLSLDSLARAQSACRNWYTCANAYPLPSIFHHRHPPWFLALPTRNRRPCCYFHNPATNRWHMLSLDFISDPIRPIASVTGGLVLIKITNSTILLLAICNPFTRQFKHLPLLNIARTNPAVGVVILSSNQYRVYVAGGMSEAGLSGATYEPTVEMYDSRDATWRIVGSMPIEYAVRLTVWTPNESVYADGVVYWMTSARAYNVMGFEIGSNQWRELSVPMADRLEFAALVKREGRLTVVGGTGGEEACVWELKGRNEWCLIEKVGIELGLKLRKGKSIKCVGGDGGIWLYRELGSEMVVWREVVGEEGRWEWLGVEGCSSIGGEQVHNLSIKGLG